MACKSMGSAMTKGSWHRVDLNDLASAYESWPGSGYTKAAMLALVLRLRIERVVEGLPAAIVRAPGRIDNLHRRLLLAIGESSLTRNDRQRRDRVIRAAIRAHQQICSVLHGRDLGRYPQVVDLYEWLRVVEALEAELSAKSSMPDAGI